MHSLAALDSTAAWQALRRLRNVSRLILVAIERDDLEAIERLADESQHLIDELRPALDGTKPDPEFAEPFAEIGAMNQMIVARLKERRDEVAREIAEAGAMRRNLRGLRDLGPAEAYQLDRET